MPEVLPLEKHNKFERCIVNHHNVMIIIPKAWVGILTLPFFKFY